MKEHVWEFDVQWAHCDAAGIVFYPHFYIWFDQSTERLFKANRLSYPELERDFEITGMPLIETGASYRNKCELGATLRMTTWVDEWQARTFVVRHRINHADGSLGLEGFERRVMIVTAPESPKGVKATEIPEEIKRRFLE